MSDSYISESLYNSYHREAGERMNTKENYHLCWKCEHLRKFGHASVPPQGSYKFDDIDNGGFFCSLKTRHFWHDNEMGPWFQPPENCPYGLEHLMVKKK